MGSAAAPEAQAASNPLRQSDSIVPGIVITALLLGGIGMFFYAEWRRAHPVPAIPDGVEPMLKIPGEIPKALRKPTVELGSPSRR